MAVLLALRIDPHVAERLSPGGTSSDFVTLGLLSAVGSTLIGYGIAWAGWWMTRR
jgi:hypothetical protein